MKNRMKILVAAVVATLATAVLVAPPPASAGTATWAREVCVTYDGGNVTTCVTPGWSKQADGSGVKLEGVYVSTQGCGHLETEGAQYVNTDIVWKAPNGNVNYRWDWNSRPCTWTLDPSDAGRDRGNMVFSFGSTARVDWGDNRRVIIEVELRPDGTSDILTRMHVTA